MLEGTYPFCPTESGRTWSFLLINASGTQTHVFQAMVLKYEGLLQ